MLTTVKNNLSSSKIDALSEVSSSLRTTLSSKTGSLDFSVLLRSGSVKRNTEVEKFILKDFISSYKNISFVALQ